jgi:hypothetical protein
VTGPARPGRPPLTGYSAMPGAPSCAPRNLKVTTSHRQFRINNCRTADFTNENSFETSNAAPTYLR